MELYFEKLRRSDLRECHRLCMNVFDENFSFEEIEKTFEICENDPHYHFVVGKCGGKIVAYTSMCVFHNLFDGLRPVAALWYVCVDESVRRMGVGKRLFVEIERIAREENCELIYFTCLSDNIGAQKFYRSLGYSDDRENGFVKYLD